MALPNLGRWLALALVFLALVEPACAQAPPVNSSVSADELQQLVDTLRDDKERAKLVQQLQTLIALQRVGEQKGQGESPSSWLSDLSTQIDAISGEIIATAGVLLDAPFLIDWFNQQAGDSRARARWLAISMKLAIVFGVAALGEWLLRLVLRRPQARLAARSSQTPVEQGLLLSTLLVVEALPVLAFAGVAAFVLPLVNPRVTSSHLAEIISQSTVTARLILAATHVALV